MRIVMDNGGMGQFIAGLRKEKQLTQKDLADRLHITDKAVSKWERGLSCPDIALLSDLAAILDVTVDELLRGERCPAEEGPQEAKIENIIEYAEKSVNGRVRAAQKICAAVYSALSIVGAAVCLICNMAVSGRLTWSLIPIISIAFAWLALFPLIRFGTKGIEITLAMLSVFVVPYLYILMELIGKTSAGFAPDITEEFPFRLSRKMALIALVFFWSVYGAFRVFRKRKLLAAALSCLFAVCTCLIINYSLAGLLGTAVIDGWDVLVIGLLLAGGAAFFVWDRRQQPV